jgi:glycosyltransferase involved in cell wall biosynthesis
MLRKRRPKRLTIFDQFFPWLDSGFTITEFHSYLDRFEDARILTLAGELPWADSRTFADRLPPYEEAYPHYARRIERYGGKKILEGDDFIYTIFHSGIAAIIDDLDLARRPFGFTLYPGGGFYLDDPATMKSLERIFSSRWFRFVIVTQRTTERYLLDNRLVPHEKIRFIFGVPVDTEQLRPLPKPQYPQEKSTFDICFVAHKYMPGGLDKGYDVFVSVARLLAGESPDYRFHVVGPWDKHDQDLEGIEDSVTFCGSQPTTFFPAFHAGMDLILSPTDTFRIHPGKFDGFPTGCCVEAALCGTPVLCTDPLGDNVAFEDGKEIVIIDRSPENIADLIERFRREPQALRAIGAAGEKRFRQVFSDESQLLPRFQALEEFLAPQATSPRRGLFSFFARRPS